MAHKIEKVAVLGTGTMGAGIAAICASKGLDVLFMDMPAKDGDRNAVAAGAKAAMSEGRAPMLDQVEDADRIEIGNFEDDMARLGEADWIVEVIIEDLAIKRSLFEKVEAARKDGSIVTTNTSGILLHKITEGMPARLRHDIAVTHFFNPVKVMKLVELIPGEETSPEVMDALGDLLGNTLDKGVVWAKDTVNFIANRIGCYFLLAGMNEAQNAFAAGLSMEDMDAALGAPVGVPPTALFGLVDLVGLDVMGLVSKNLQDNLPGDDAGRAYAKLPTKVEAMYGRGQIGRKAGGGFYRMRKTDDGAKVKEVFDLKDETWRDAGAVVLDEAMQNLGGIMSAETAHGQYVRTVMGGTMLYAADLVPQISDDVVNIDRAMRWGFNWRQGPFELIDALGAKNVIGYLEEQGTPLPAMLQVLKDAEAESFYRNDGQEFFGLDGNYHPVP